MAGLLYRGRHLLDAGLGRRRPLDRRSRAPDLADVLPRPGRSGGSRVPHQDRAQQRFDAGAAHRPQRHQCGGAGRARRRGRRALQLPHTQPPLPGHRSLLRHDVRHAAQGRRRPADLVQEDRAEERLHPRCSTSITSDADRFRTERKWRSFHVQLQHCIELRGRRYPLHRMQGRREGARCRLPRPYQPADGLLRRCVRHLQVPCRKRQL